MTELMSYVPAAICHSGHRCDRAPWFQAQFDAAAGQNPVQRNAVSCAEHLGATVQVLAAWARDQGLHGKVTVLATDRQPPRQASRAAARPGERLRFTFDFGTIALTPSGQ
jgi:hypothetical protein